VVAWWSVVGCGAVARGPLENWRAATLFLVYCPLWILRALVAVHAREAVSYLNMGAAAIDSRARAVAAARVAVAAVVGAN